MPSSHPGGDPFSHPSGVSVSRPVRVSDQPASWRFVPSRCAHPSPGPPGARKRSVPNRVHSVGSNEWLAPPAGGASNVLQEDTPLRKISTKTNQSAEAPLRSGRFALPKNELAAFRLRVNCPFDWKRRIISFPALLPSRGIGLHRSVRIPFCP